MALDMTTDSRTISIDFVRDMVNSAQKIGCDTDDVLKQADIPLAVLLKDKARVSIDKFGLLTELLREATGDEAVGYYKNPVKPGTFETMARYAIASQSLQDAIHRNVSFHNLFDTGLTVEFHNDGKKAIYRLTPEQSLTFSPFVYEQWLMINRRFFCWITGNRFPLLQINMNYPAPAHKDEYHYMFHCQINFAESHSELIFESKYLTLPVIKNSDDLEGYLSHAPYSLLQMPGKNKSYTEQIRRRIKKSLPKLVDYNQLAAELNLNPQTLRRRLKDEGADYRQIRNEFIRDMAIDYLRREDLEIKEITYLLGFSEPSAFVRSFKKWTGMSPNTYRKENLQREETAIED